MAYKGKHDASKKEVTASHKVLILGLSIYAIAVVTTIISVFWLFGIEYYGYAVQTLTVLATEVGTITGVIYGFYANKAKAENAEKLKANRYALRMEMAREVYRDYKDKKIDDKSVELVRKLISDNTDYELPEVNTGTVVPTLTPILNFDNNNNGMDGLG